MGPSVRIPSANTPPGTLGDKATMADDHISGRKSVLVVDDNEDICAFVMAALESEGLEVRVAHEGAQALTLQRRRPADLLITDIFMPVQDGLETINLFKAEFPQTCIIAMSRTCSRCIRAGRSRRIQGIFLRRRERHSTSAATPARDGH